MIFSPHFTFPGTLLIALPRGVSLCWFQIQSDWQPRLTITGRYSTPPVSMGAPCWEDGNWTSRCEWSEGEITVKLLLPTFWKFFLWLWVNHSLDFPPSWRATLMVPERSLSLQGILEHPRMPSVAIVILSHRGEQQCLRRATLCPLYLGTYSIRSYIVAGTAPRLLRAHLQF